MYDLRYLLSVNEIMVKLLLIIKSTKSAIFRLSIFLVSSKVLINHQHPHILKILHGALIQIEILHPNNCSTVISFETFHLPDKDSPLFERMKELGLVIFNVGNEIISWGRFKKELKNFQKYDFLNPGNEIIKTNLQDEFRKWYNKQATSTHAIKESREQTWWTNYIYETAGDNDDFNEEQSTQIKNHDDNYSHYDFNKIWSI